MRMSFCHRPVSGNVAAHPISKNLIKKHLSPSRRRALCPFFVQTGSGVQTVLPPKPAARPGRCFAIKALQKSVMALHLRQGATGEWSRWRGVRFTGPIAVKTCCRRCFRFRNHSYQRPTSRCRARRENDCEAQPV